MTEALENSDANVEKNTDAGGQNYKKEEPKPDKWRCGFKVLIGFLAFVCVSVASAAIYLAWPTVVACRTVWRSVEPVPFPFLDFFWSDPCISLNEFGDFLAGSFAAVAFVGLIITILIQSQELKEQRKVALEQKNEMAEQAEFLGKQARLMADTMAMQKSERENRELDVLVDLFGGKLIVNNQYADWEASYYMVRFGRDQLQSIVSTTLTKNLHGDYPKNTLRRFNDLIVPLERIEGYTRHNPVLKDRFEIYGFSGVADALKKLKEIADKES